MSKKNRLHKGTLATKAFKRLTNLAFPLLIYSFIGLSDGEFLQTFLITLTIFILLMMIGFVFDLIKYIRTAYYIENNRFILKSGLIIRKEKDIQISRIQSIDTAESLAHRLLKLSKVTIQTPGKNILLDAISLKQLEEITQQLYDLNTAIEVPTNIDISDNVSEETLAKPDTSSTPSEGDLLYQLSITDLIKLTLLNTSAIRSFIVFFFASSFVSNILIDFVFEQSDQILRVPILVLLFIALGIFAMIYLFSAVITIIKQYHFRVFSTDTQLTIKRGLLETNSQTIVLDNVQSLEEKQNWLMKLCGFTFFSLSIATHEQEDEADSNKENDTNGKIVLFPLVKTDQLTSLIESCFPEYHLASAKLVTPKRSIRRFIQFQLLFFIVIATVISKFFWIYAWIPGIILILLTLLFGYLSYKLNGYALSENEVTFQVAKTFSIKRTYLLKERILTMKVNQHPLLKRAALAKVSCFSAQGQLSQENQLKFIDDKDAFELFNWFKPKNGGHDDYESNKS
ncbi:PH domain-containing protein [Marinilactibacillus kalidii]|uniref:PH domain-containing protein n=1 Tax=Marinilactibacillus kalidii TaxID=2820274 RepID=UPI001ABE29A1|nr:PH domain-containing protein [Marinilactibacillus kalidii]